MWCYWIIIESQTSPRQKQRLCFSGETGKQVFTLCSGISIISSTETRKAYCKPYCRQSHCWAVEMVLFNWFWSHQFSSVTQSYLTLCNPMDCSTPGFSVHHQLPELTQTHIHRVNDAIQPSHPLLSLSPPTFNLSQHQDLFQWVSSSYEVDRVLEFQLQHQSFQWTFKTDFL